MHGPSRSASKRSRSAYPARVRETSRRAGTAPPTTGYRCTAELQGLDTHLGIDSLPIPGAQLQGLEIEEVDTLGHAVSC